MGATEHPSGRYIPANGLQMYVEERGQGEPLLLIHGGTGSSAGWGLMLPALAAHYRVIMPDSRGHGRTVHPGGPLTYQMMADDMAALIHSLALGRPRICGYSDGGQIGLDLAVRYPQLVRAVIISGATHRWSTTYYEQVAGLGFVAPGEVDAERFMAMVNRLRTNVALRLPERDDASWLGLATALSTAWLTPHPYTDDDLRGMTAPALILVGDRDAAMPLDDQVALYRLIPDAELAVVPGATHGFPWTRPTAFTAVVLDFLLRHQDAPATEM